MTSVKDSKRDMPIEEQMRESWARTQEIIAYIHALSIIYTITYSITIVLFTVVTFFIFHWKLNDITNIILMSLGIFGVIIGITIGWGLSQQKKMLKEYDESID